MFGAGCFWGVEETFRKLEGVVKTEVGYAGGRPGETSYRAVCTGETGHAEVTRIQFDPKRVSFETLLDVFWQCHDPTTRDRQGPDIGHQYRSVIFACSDDQEGTAKDSRKHLDTSGRLPRSVVTQICEWSEFHRAEDYHQRYLERRGQPARPPS